jgi:hypothetical protein
LHVLIRHFLKLQKLALTLLKAEAELRCRGRVRTNAGVVTRERHSPDMVVAVCILFHAVSRDVEERDEDW